MSVVRDGRRLGYGVCGVVCAGQLAGASLAGVCVMAAPPAVPAAEWESPSCLRCLPEPEPEPEPWSQLGHLVCVYVPAAVDQLELFG